MFQVEYNNISTMKQEIKALDAKIKSLSNFFHSYCKSKGEPSSTNTITLAQDHVKTKTCGRFLRQDLQVFLVLLWFFLTPEYILSTDTFSDIDQLWKVDDFKSRNGHYTVLLNYQGYLSQRFLFFFFPAECLVI